MRVDRYLKLSRLVKRRTVAQELCGEGRVQVNGRTAEPAKTVRVGDRVAVRYAAGVLEVEVTALPDRPSSAGSEPPYRIVDERSAREGT